MSIRSKLDGQDKVVEALDRGFAGKATEVARYKDDGTFKGNHAKDSVGGVALSVAAFRPKYATGRNAAGAVTLTGAKVGDKVAMAINLTDAAAGEAAFEATITVAGQIQQSSGADLSAKKFAFLLIAKS